MKQHQQGERGFSLVESVIAMGVVMVGVLGLAQVYVLAVNHLMASSEGLVAREKAREALESIHAARDARTITWVQMRNVTAPSGCSGASSGGGIFSVGLTPLYRPGTDGLVNTTNASTTLETSPGPNGRLGDADDVPLRNYQREIKICDIDSGLRQIIVNVQYTVAGRTLTFTLTSLISEWS